MPRLTIKTSLLSIFALIATLTAIFAWSSITSLSSMNSSADGIATDALPSVNIARTVETNVLSLRLAYLTHLTSQTDEARTKAEDNIAKQQDRIRKVFDDYTPLANTDHEKDLLNTLRKGIDAYGAIGKDLLPLSRKGDMNGALDVIAKQREEIGPVMSAADELVKINLEAAESAKAKVSAAYLSATRMGYAMTGIVVLIVIGGAVFAMMQIARPIQGITVSMEKLAEGDTTSAIPYSHRKDEIGDMAGAVEVFRQAAIANKRLEKEAEENRGRAEAERVRMQADAEAAAQSRLQQATAGLAAGLRRLAAGDLAFSLNEAFAPDFEQLRHDLNAAVKQLGQTLSTVATSTHSIDDGSREISRSAEDLSKRTEQQAASLEETAAALDQITANVVNSSKRAEEARKVAVEANASAAQSGKVVANAVDAMQRIEQSSSQISNIIGVIDEIAFQTNLLALNAGVEAARAGEAGKGFAVVAQEVRELAQRSAQAAKEIKDLIRNSTGEVETGVKLVKDTGEALKTIEQHVVIINGHMDAIASSSREQSTGLAEVNTAVNQMDQVTQQNAAMVEETNAASAALAMESNRLRELIAQFSLGAAGGPRLAEGSGNSAAGSPARRLANRVSHAFSGNAAASQDGWESF